MAASDLYFLPVLLPPICVLLARTRVPPSDTASHRPARVTLWQALLGHTAKVDGGEHHAAFDIPVEFLPHGESHSHPASLYVAEFCEQMA